LTRKNRLNSLVGPTVTPGPDPSLAVVAIRSSPGADDGELAARHERRAVREQGTPIVLGSAGRHIISMR
jgi:hypothetical protein